MMETTDITNRLTRLGQHLDDERAALAADTEIEPLDSHGIQTQHQQTTTDDRVMIESATVSTRHQSRFRWLAAAASVLLIGGALFALRQPATTDVATSFAVSGDESGAAFGWPDASIGDVIVWVQGTADAAAIAAIDQQIAAIADTSDYRFISADDAYADFAESTRDDPALAASVTAADIGGYFRIVTADPHAVEVSFRDLPSVASVEVVGDRLYLLPPSDAPVGSNVTSFTDLDAGNVDEGSGVMVARKTATGYDQMVVIANLTSGSSFGRGVPEMIGGIEMVAAEYDPAVVGRELENGSWLEFYAGSDRAVLADVIAHTSVIDGLIDYQPSEQGPLEVGRVDDISGGRFTTLFSTVADGVTLDPTPLYRIRTFEDREGFPLLSPFADSADTITVRGHEGSVAQFAATADRRARIEIVWRETPGVAAGLGMDGTVEELVDMADRLRPVNASVWRAVLEARSNE